MNPAVLQGKPVVRGTRIPVEAILRKLSEGATEADILDAYASEFDTGSRRMGVSRVPVEKCREASYASGS